MITAALLAGGPAGGSAPYHADAVHFDGATFLQRGAPLTGVSDGPLGTMLYWIKAGSSSNNALMASYPHNNFEVYNSSGLIMQTYMGPTPAHDTDTLQLNTSNVFSGTWLGVLQTWDTSIAPPRKWAVYVSGVQDVLGTTDGGSTAFNVPYADNDFFLGQDGYGDIIGGDVANVLLWTNVCIAQSDGTIAAPDLANFFDGSNKPINPATAISAYGTPALAFIGNASTFPTNQGTGGAFTTTGTLTNAGTSPSD